MSKLIGEGGFGCVYYPQLTCDGKITQNKKNVSKIQILDKYVQRELDIGKIISKLQFFSLHFAPIIKSCRINISSFDKNSLLKDCEIVSNNLNEKFILSTIPYIKGKEFRDYISELQENNLYIFILLNSYYYILNSLQILQEIGICHYDIKFENIIYNIDSKIPIIIDFGLSFLFKDVDDYKSIYHLKHFFYVYAPHYYIWCPEIQIISYIVNKNTENKDIILTDELLKKILIEIVENMGIWKFFTNDFKDNYLKNLYIFYSQFINKGNNTIIKELLKYKKTWDTYSISISFLKECIEKFKTNNNFEIGKPILLIFIQLLLYSLSPNPNKRPTISKLKEILYTTFNKQFPKSLSSKFLDFSLTDNEHKYIINEVVPYLYLFKN